MAGAGPIIVSSGIKETVMTEATAAAPASGSTLSTIATTAEGVVESVMKVEPTIATFAGMFIPGAAPIIAAVQPEVMLAAPFVENALKALAAGNGGDVLGAFIQLLQHLTPNQPNAAILQNATSPTPTQSPAIGIG